MKDTQSRNEIRIPYEKIVKVKGSLAEAMIGNTTNAARKNQDIPEITCG